MVNAIFFVAYWVPEFARFPGHNWLFDQLAPWHGLDDRHRELLEAAALLANVGLFISHSGHHKHSYYVIRNSEHLTGFTDGEVELIAQVARYHRKSAPRRKHAEFAALGRDDQHRVRVLAGLLRVAVGLDRNHGAHVASVGVVPGDDDALVIEVSEVGESRDFAVDDALGKIAKARQLALRESCTA